MLHVATVKCYQIPYLESNVSRQAAQNCVKQLLSLHERLHRSDHRCRHIAFRKKILNCLLVCISSGEVCYQHWGHSTHRMYLSVVWCGTSLVVQQCVKCLCSIIMSWKPKLHFIMLKYISCGPFRVLDN